MGTPKRPPMGTIARNAPTIEWYQDQLLDLLIDLCAELPVIRSRLFTAPTRQTEKGG
jgi:hypothetical protein